MAKYSEYLDIDWNSLNKLKYNELREITKILNKQANKQYKSLESTEIGQLSPAYQGHKESDISFTIRGKNLNQLRETYAKANEFIQAKTSSWRKFKKIRKEFQEKIDFSFGNIDQEKEFWRIYRKVEEDGLTTYGSVQIQSLIAKAFSNPAEVIHQINDKRIMDDSIAMDIANQLNIDEDEFDFAFPRDAVIEYMSDNGLYLNERFEVVEYNGEEDDKVDLIIQMNRVGYESNSDYESVEYDEID